MPITTQTKSANQVNHQQHQHEIDVSKHTISNVSKIHTNKYIQHDPSKLITISMREKGTDEYKNAHIQTVAIKFSRRLEREPSDSGTFI